MSEQCLELKNVCKRFHDFTLNNISFTLPQGYIMGLVGPNGAGKTTTIQLILNMLEKKSGEILIFGKDNVIHEKDIKQEIGVVFDSMFYVDSWTVQDTGKAISIFYDNWQHDIFNDMINRFSLERHKKGGGVLLKPSASICSSDSPRFGERRCSRWAGRSVSWASSRDSVWWISAGLALSDCGTVFRSEEE